MGNHRTKKFLGLLYSTNSICESDQALSRFSSDSLATRDYLNAATAPKLMSVDVPYGPEKKSWDESLSPLARSPSGRLLVSPPSWDPLKSYDYKQEAVTSSWYQVPSTGLSEEQRSKALAETARAAQLSVKDTLGFQAKFREFAHAECAQGFLNTHFNNGGDPFGPSYDGLSTLWMERNVLDYYASLWHAKWPHDPKDPESYWGYPLTMGSTEGNLYAVWNARDYLSGKYVGGSPNLSKCAFSNYHYEQCVSS